MDSVSVLLIDDDPAHRMLEKRALRRAFPAARIAECGSTESARSAIESSSGAFEIAVIDLNLAGNSGLELVRLLRSTPQHASTPVVLISTSQLEHDVHSSYRAGVDCYIFKSDDPLTFDQHLFAAVQFLVRQPG